MEIVKRILCAALLAVLMAPLSVVSAAPYWQWTATVFVRMEVIKANSTRYSAVFEIYQPNGVKEMVVQTADNRGVAEAFWRNGGLYDSGEYTWRCLVEDRLVAEGVFRFDRGETSMLSLGAVTGSWAASQGFVVNLSIRNKYARPDETVPVEFVVSGPSGNNRVSGQLAGMKFLEFRYPQDFGARIVSGSYEWQIIAEGNPVVAGDFNVEADRLILGPGRVIR